MKIFLSFLIVFLLNITSFAQEYYHYKGRIITLTPRPDKIALIFNDLPYSNSYIKNKIQQTLRAGDELIEVDDNIYSINISNSKDIMQMESYLSSLKSDQNLEGMIKFVTKVYYGESERVSQIPADEIIVKLNSLNDFEKLKSLNSQYNLHIIRNIGDEKGFLLKSNNGIQLNGLELSDIYYKTGIFEYAEPNFFYPDLGMLNYDPNDPLYSQQWALKNTGQSVTTEGSSTYGDLTSVNGIPGADMEVWRAWDYVKGNSQVKIAMYDTGVDDTHPDLAANMVTGYNAHSNGYVITDTYGHGTCVTGVVGAVSNNNLGIAGIVGGDNTSGSACQIMGFKATSSGSTFTSNANIARGFDTARTRNVHVVSNSWGGGTPNSTMTDAINNCANNSRDGLGTVILFSSGNDGRNPPNYPSYLSSVVCVGASTQQDQKKSSGTGNQFWWGGNYGEDSNGDLDVVAPTVVYATDIQGTGGFNTSSGTAGNYYATFNGTSAACPNAAGVVGLIFSVNPNFSAAQVKEYLYRGAEKIDNIGYNTTKTYGKWNEYNGYGRVNAYNSVRLAMGVDVTPPTIVHENISSHNSTYPTTITALIIDQDGSSVRTTNSNSPKIFYMFNKNGAGWPSSFDSANAVSNDGNTYTFKIPGVGYGTEVRYYIKASDASGNTTTFPLHANKDYPYTLCYYAVGNTEEVTGKVTDRKSVV